MYYSNHSCPLQHYKLYIYYITQIIKYNNTANKTQFFKNNNFYKKIIFDHHAFLD